MKTRTLTLTLSIIAFPCLHADIVTRGDFNGDGVEDTVLVDETSGNLAVGIGNPAVGGDFRDWSIIDSCSCSSAPAVADIDSNGNDDIALADFRSNRVILLEGRSDGSFRRLEFPVAGPQGVGFADIEPGGPLELVVLADAGEDGPKLIGINATGGQRSFDGATFERGRHAGFRVLHIGADAFAVSTSRQATGESISLNYTRIEPDYGGANDSVSLDCFHTRTTEVAMFGGEPHTVLWDPGHNEVTVALILPAVQSIRESTRASAPVGEVVIVPGIPDDQVLIIAQDGKSAELYDYNQGKLARTQSFLPPAGLQFSAAQALVGGKLQFVVEDGADRSSGLVEYALDGRMLSQSDVALAVSLSSKTTVVAYTKNPLLHADALEIERFAQGQWATSAKTVANVINAQVETFGGVSSGLGNAGASDFHPAIDPVGALANQFEPDSSICFLGAAGFSGAAGVTINPPPGNYGVTVAMSFNVQTKTTVIYRANNGDWKAWNGESVFLTQSTEVEFYGQHSSGLLSQIESASYGIEQSLAQADANRDGLPDIVAAAFNLDPFGNGNADGDAFSDLDEILGGSDPNDPDSAPGKSSLVSTVQCRIINAASDGTLRDAANGDVRLARLDGSHVAAGIADGSGAVALEVPFGALNGLGLAVFTKRLPDGIEIEMVAGVVGAGDFPEIPVDSSASAPAADWVQRARAAARAFQSVAGLDFGGEVIEISPRSTLEVLTFEAILGEVLIASGRIQSLADAPSVFPPSHGMGFFLPDLGGEVIVAQGKAYEMAGAMRQARARIQATAHPEWAKALETLYTARRAAPLIALRQLFLDNRIPAAYAEDLNISPTALALEAAAIKDIDSGRQPIAIAGTVALADARCLVLTAVDGTRYALTESNARPFQPGLAIVNGSAATATGLLGSSDPVCADEPFIVLSLSVIAPRPGDPMVDIDGDNVADSYELTFSGTLAYGANDDPDGDGITLIQAYAASAPPSGGAIHPPSPPTPIQVVIAHGAQANELILSWKADPGGSFSVSASTSLASWEPTGTAVVETLPGVYQWQTITRPEVSNVTFYRVARQ